MSDPGELQRAVSDELAFDPTVDATSIGVAVTGEGVVTLQGRVDSYAAKLAAEKAAKRVRWVWGVANDLVVALPLGTVRGDTEIAQAAVRALDWNTELHGRDVRVLVQDGWVTLEGVLDWQYQRAEAEHAVEHLMGVKGVSNRITLVPRSLPGAVEERVHGALRRAGAHAPEEVRVSTMGGRVVLRGVVDSWAEREAAERAAWSVPGVTEVDDELWV